MSRVVGFQQVPDTRRDVHRGKSKGNPNPMWDDVSRAVMDGQTLLVDARNRQVIYNALTRRGLGGAVTVHKSDDGYLVWLRDES